MGSLGAIQDMLTIHRYGPSFWAAFVGLYPRGNKSNTCACQCFGRCLTSNIVGWSLHHSTWSCFYSLGFNELMENGPRGRLRTMEYEPRQIGVFVWLCGWVCLCAVVCVCVWTVFIFYVCECVYMYVNVYSCSYMCVCNYVGVYTVCW